MSAESADIPKENGSTENEHPPASSPPDSAMSTEPTSQESSPTTVSGTATAEAATESAATTTTSTTAETSNSAAPTSHPNPTSHPPPPPPPPPHPSYDGQPPPPPPPGPYAAYYGYGHPPPHIPPPGYEGQPPHGITTEGGHRAPGPYTTAQYDPAKMAPGRGGNQGGVPPPLYHGSHAGPPHGGHTRSPSGSSPPHAVAHTRDPPPPPHYPPPPMHGPPPDHTRPSPPGAYPPYRDAHHPHWGAHPDYAAAGHPPPPPPRYYDATQPPPAYPPPPAQGYATQPPAGMEHGHPGPYRYSDPTLRRQAVESRSLLSAAERYSDVDGREGATSPSQIESSHREEVTSMGCTCKKTKCLKLYCQCFAVKIYCAGNCRCLICRNTAKFEKERKDAIRNILSRNPSAFDTKFKKTLDGRPAPDRPVVDTSRVLAHKLGCKCRKSACMKKYCECYAGNVKCSANCRCVGCKNMPPGGLGPTSGPTGGAILNQTASVGSSEGDAQHAISKPGKRREPWMMNAAQNLAFLKHSSPAAKPSRPGGSHDVGDVASMPSLASEVSPADSKFEETKTVSAAGASKIPEPTSSEKTAVNALLMAAMAMTEMGAHETTAPKSDTKMPYVDRHPSKAPYETPPKAQVSRETTNNPDRAQSTSDERTQEARPTVSPTVASEDEDSPKRDLPDSTPCNQQKVKRSRIGSHRKGPRNLGEEMNDGAPPDEKMSPAHVYSNYNGGNPIVETPDSKIRGKKEEITPVSARCIDFRRMNVTGAQDQTD